MGGGLVAITGKIDVVGGGVGRGGSATTKPSKCTSMIFSAHTQASPINEDKSFGCSRQIMPVFIYLFFYSFYILYISRESAVELNNIPDTSDTSDSCEAVFLCRCTETAAILLRASINKQQLNSMTF